MKKMIGYQLIGGETYFDIHVAKREADKKYGRELSSLAHNLVRQEKYTNMMTFLDENIHLFIELKALKDDVELEEEEKEE